MMRYWWVWVPALVAILVAGTVMFGLGDAGPEPSAWADRGSGPVSLVTPRAVTGGDYVGLDLSDCLSGHDAGLNLKVSAWVSAASRQSQFSAVCSGVRRAWGRDRLPFTEKQLRLASAAGAALLRNRLAGDHAVGDMSIGAYMRTVDRLEGLYMALYEVTLP